MTFFSPLEKCHFVKIEMVYGNVAVSTTLSRGQNRVSGQNKKAICPRIVNGLVVRALAWLEYGRLSTECPNPQAILGWAGQSLLKDFKTLFCPVAE